ncbi:Integrase catalytic domain-containing protein [Citrus sinensis]|uniref:Integrase catalytic domain-containing protein n=1 Tax=Citrus sinensis TaxID=2711 RepID=A0ACB8IQ51_CITSI|nr:Integrase catalytic domain-containing protein [Citrus sinensis]
MAEASSSSSSTRTTVTNVKFEVEKFDGTNNFGMWQCEVLDVLCQQELDVALEEKPHMMDDKEWIKINRQACGTCLCLAKDHKYSVMRETSAKKLWETLEEKYMKKSLENRLYMKKKLYHFTYTPGMSMNDHVNSFNKILADLLNLDEQFIDEDKALLLLNSLPDEYDHLTTTLLHGKDSVTFDVVCSALYNFETRKKDRNDHRDTVAEVLTARVIGSTSIVFGKDADSEATKLWHMHLGHAGEKALQTLAKQGLLKGTNSCKLQFCEHCVLGKKTRVKFGSTIHDTKGILEYVHSDVWGPTKTASLGGMHYFVTFVYDYSRKVWMYLMKNKNEVLGILLKWKKMVETQTGRKVKRFRSDNGGEYKNDLFLQICQDEGIVRHFTVRDTPQQNGVAERMNRTILEKARCMLSNARLDKESWAEAVVYACHLINRLPSTTIEGRTPMEMWIGKPATNYDFLHVFGSTAYYYVKESKLDPRAKKALFIGIIGGVKGYRLWCPITKKIIFGRDVTFDESTMLKQKDSQEDDKTSSNLQQVEFEKVKADPAGVDEMDSDSPSTDDDEEVLTQEPSQQQDSIAYRRPRREIRRPARFVDMVAYALPIVDDNVPSTYREAVSNPESIQWKKAMNEKMQSLHKNETWELVTLPKEKKAIGCKWVYAKKEGFPRKNEIRYKVRLVAKGYTQKEGIDYNEVFSPAVKHSDLEEKIYMTQPDGFKVAGKENWVCKWTKSLYGLKQSPRQWYKRFDRFMKGQSKDEIEKLKTQLNQEFEMKDLGEAKKILGMEICRDKARGKVSSSQKQYLKKILQQFGMTEQTKPVSTPLASHFKLSVQLSSSTDTEGEYMLQVPFSNAVGSLMYAMILQYIQKTVDVGLLFERDDTLGQGVIGYVDSDYAGDLDKRRSTTGYVFTFARGPISWKSTLQSTIALSTIEAEYMAITEAVKEAIWLQGLLENLGLAQEHINEIVDEGKILLQKIKTADNPADMLTKVVTAIKFEHCLNL